jgi:hypothetical protein
MRGVALTEGGSDLTVIGAPGSNGESEFGERRRELTARLDVGSDVVVTTAQVLHERVSSTDHPRRARIPPRCPRSNCSPTPPQPSPSPPQPTRPVADLSHERITCRPVLGGLICEYERAG